MARKGVNGKRIHSAAKQAEILSKPINMTGAGEDAAVADFMKKNLLEDVRASDIPNLMAVARIVRGDLTEEEIRMFNTAREILTNREKAAIAFEADRAKFMENVQENANSLRVSEEGRAKIQARVSSELSEYMAKAHARKRAMIDSLKEEPQELVVWPFTIEYRTQNRTPVPVQVPVTISIGSIKFRYAPGVSVSVPRSVAAQVKDFYKSEEEQQLRKMALDTTRRDTETAKLWEKANALSSADLMPTYGGN